MVLYLCRGLLANLSYATTIWVIEASHRSRCFGTCCSGYKHPQKFWLAPNFEASLAIFPWWLHTLRFTSWVHGSLCICLACSFHPSFCMSVSKSCLQPCFGYAQRLRFMCSCYDFLWKYLSHSHMESHSLLHKHFHGRSTINYECRTCRLHRRSVMLNMWV